MNYRHILITLLFVSQVGILIGQQAYKLAVEYFNNGEYEKSAQLFENLYTETQNKTYFDYYIQSLLESKEYTKAQNILNKEIKAHPQDVSLYVIYGGLLERIGEQEEANIQYNNALNNIQPDPTIINNLAKAFTNLAKYDLAIKTYLKGEKVSNIEGMYNYNLADLYRRSGDIPHMIKYYLKEAGKGQDRVQNIQTSIQRYIEEDQYVELQKQLYQCIQADNKNPSYPQMLEWTFTHLKQYDKALRQAKAIDRNYEGDGRRVFAIGELAYREKDYDVAIDAFDYILTTHGRNTTYYISAQSGLLNSKKAKVTQTFTYTDQDLEELKKAYNSFLNEVGRNSQTAQIIREFAEFEALYVNELDTAILLLEEVKTFGALPSDYIADIKLVLGDYYLMQEDRWEASLLYSQVDKDFKEGVLGELARLKNAKLSYYSGDFEWAQEQFKILKTATSKLISNDAIDMSVFILDNLGLDTTDVTLGMFSQAELLMFQNKYDEAITLLDSINVLFPEHALQDDIAYVKANIFKKLRRVDEAISMYSYIIEHHKEDIRCDNAIFELAEMYEIKLNQPEKAKQLYEKLFLEYSGSIFAVDARERFRRLRGDNL